MKRCHENSFAIIPSDAFGYIYHYLSPESKKALSLVDNHRLQECSELAKAICFLPPKKFSKVDGDIYISLIKRYPNIRKITFQSLCRKTNALDTHHKIGVLIQFLTENKACHPLSHVTEMDIEEIKCPFIDRKKGQIQKLFFSLLEKQNQDFLNALSHPNLEALTLRLRHYSVSNHTIQSILDQTQLKYLQIKGSSYDLDDVGLSFIKQSKLTSLSVSNFIYSSTIKSLVNCCNSLEDFGFNCEADHDEIANHSYPNLKRLKLGSLFSSDDTKFISKMPNVESLIIGEISTHDKILEPFIDCPNLRELRIGKFHIEDEDHIYTVLNGLSNLEFIDLGGTYYPDIEKFMEPIKSMYPKINDFILMHSPHELEEMERQNDTPYQRAIFFSNTNPVPKFLANYDL